MFIQVFFLLLGLGLLTLGADRMVDGASALAKKHNISELVIGLTIVAFGTSAPELVVNTIASFQNHKDIVFGNIIGSNMFNLFMILGVAGLITPLAVQSGIVWKEIPLSFFGIIMLFILANDFSGRHAHILTRTDGFILLIMFLLFLIYMYNQLKTRTDTPEIKLKTHSNLKLWTFILLGLAGMVVGGKLVVTNAILMATTLGVSEKIIAMTIVAAGTSLPELATSVVATIKKNIDLAVGNVIGSNIFNIFLILSVSSLVRPIPYDVLFNRDLYLLACGTIFLFIAMFTGYRKKLDRWEAGILLVSFIVYMGYLIETAK